MPKARPHARSHCIPPQHYEGKDRLSPSPPKEEEWRLSGVEWPAKVLKLQSQDFSAGIVTST